MRFLMAGACALFLLSLPGCAGRGKDAAPPERTWTRTVEGTCEGSRDAVWNAVLRALSGYSIQQKDAGTGMAVTGWKSAIVPHDMLGPQGAILVSSGKTDRSMDVLRTPARVLMINFTVKSRLTVSLKEGAAGKTVVSLTRQMYVTYFDGPKGSMNPEVYERLRGDFDTEEEVNRVLKTILDTGTERK